MTTAAPLPASELIPLLCEARSRTFDLVLDLSEEQLLGPRLAIVNPPLWEVGHVAWFQERWVLRHWRKMPPSLDRGDALYDSAKVDHDARWDLPLPNRRATFDYLERVLDRVTASLDEREPGPQGTYFVLLALFHEYMHSEALTYTRQTHGYPMAPLGDLAPSDHGARGTEPAGGDARIPGGKFQLGATRDLPFVFDNEKWAHGVEARPFSIARTPVTHEEFALFVEDEGYQRQEPWTEQGWIWRSRTGAHHPAYWKRDIGGGWQRRHFDEWVPLEGRLPVTHVNWYEAEAFCRWAGRRLPTETEWEIAASAEPTPDATRLADRKRRFPWGDEPPSLKRANLDWRARGPVSVDALPAGDSAFGCRQMMGNVWEWTSSDFTPYPGFVPDPYEEYSQPWFGDHKVLRGGCWTTRSLLIRNTWRNFYQPHRRDVFAGFRTCAL